jgi:hypothetical protein
MAALWVIIKDNHAFMLLLVPKDFVPIQHARLSSGQHANHVGTKHKKPSTKSASGLDGNFVHFSSG